jgi:transposase InsO family protein
MPIYLVTDNGPCFKAGAFVRFLDARPELAHIRTRERSPQTNGVIERYHGAIKFEQLWRQLPADGTEMARMVDEFRHLYNDVRPHAYLDGDRPADRYLAEPTTPPSDDPIAPLRTRQTARVPWRETRPPAINDEAKPRLAQRALAESR